MPEDVTLPARKLVLTFHSWGLVTDTTLKVISMIHQAFLRHKHVEVIAKRFFPKHLSQQSINLSMCPPQLEVVKIILRLFCSSEAGVESLLPDFCTISPAFVEVITKLNEELEDGAVIIPECLHLCKALEPGPHIQWFTKLLGKII
jgi:hypothetical protein